MDFEEIIKKHNFRTEIPRHMRRSAGYLAPEEVEGFLLGILISQNPDIFAKLLDDIRRKTRGELMVSLSEKLDLSPPSPPDIYLLEQGIESGYTFVYTEHESWVGLSHKAILESVESTTNHPLIHELAHYLMYVFNKEAMMDDLKGNPENRKFNGYLGNGLFLERNRFQMEGFAEWLSGGGSYLNTYEKLAEATKQMHGMWSCMKFLRREFDNTYSLGAIVYHLVEKADGLEGVKDLAFARSVDRAGMLAKYRELCAFLDLDTMEPPPRRKRLLETYQDMVGCEAVERDLTLESTIEGIDQKIDALQQQGKEPQILYYTDGSPLLDIVTESYWHHGIFVRGDDCKNLTDEQKGQMNVLPAFSHNVYDCIDKGSWNLFIDNEGSVLKDVIKGACADKNITYVRTP